MLSLEELVTIDGCDHRSANDQLAAGLEEVDIAERVVDCQLQDERRCRHSRLSVPTVDPEELAAVVAQQVTRAAISVEAEHAIPAAVDEDGLQDLRHRREVHQTRSEEKTKMEATWPRS